jgi:hypothetical protein
LFILAILWGFSLGMNSFMNRLLLLLLIFSIQAPVQAQSATRSQAELPNAVRAAINGHLTTNYCAAWITSFRPNTAPGPRC